MVDDRGSLILLLLLLLSLALFIALPVLQLVIIEQRASIYEQIRLQTHYLAEAGLVRAQQLLRFNVDAPLPSAEQALGNGAFNLHRDAGDRQIVAQGRIGSITSSLALSYEPWELSQGYLLWLGSDEKPGYFSLSEAVRARVAGQALVIGDLIIAENAFLEVDSGLTLTGELLGEGELEPLPTFAATPDSRELWSWLQQSLLVAGEPPPQPLAGTLYLESGVTYECLSADWTDLQVIGPREDEPAATLIVRGDLHWQSCVGHINLLVAGDCWQPTEPSGRLMLDGVLWVQGHLDVHNLQVRGALIAGSLEVHADLLPGWNLTVEQFPGQVSGAGLVVPKVKAWEYLFE